MQPDGNATFLLNEHAERSFQILDSILHLVDLKIVIYYTPLYCIKCVQPLLSMEVEARTETAYLCKLASFPFSKLRKSNV